MTVREAWGALALGLAGLAFLLAASVLSFARDTTGLSAQLTPEQGEWVKGLKNSIGQPCCDDADGIDPVWEIHGDGYRVMINNEWVRVEPGAVLPGPNRIGVARAWMGHLMGKPFVRCFLPGPSI